MPTGKPPIFPLAYHIENSLVSDLYQRAAIGAQVFQSDVHFAFKRMTGFDPFELVKSDDEYREYVRWSRDVASLSSAAVQRRDYWLSLSQEARMAGVAYDAASTGDLPNYGTAASAAVVADWSSVHMRESAWDSGIDYERGVSDDRQAREMRESMGW